MAEAGPALLLGQRVEEAHAGTSRGVGGGGPDLGRVEEGGQGIVVVTTAASATLAIDRLAGRPGRNARGLQDGLLSGSGCLVVAVAVAVLAHVERRAAGASP